MKSTYEVIVQNIGMVHQGTEYTQAYLIFNDYIRKSKIGEGRASGSNVTLMQNDELFDEYIPCDSSNVKPQN